MQDFVNKFLEKKYFRRYLRENRQKFFVTFSRFWPLKGWGWGRGWICWKRKIWDENFFQIMLNEILESCENDICWYNVKRIKKLVAVSYNFSQKYLLKTCGWHSMGFLLKNQNLQSMTKVICRGPLSGWLLSLEFKVYLKKSLPCLEM